MISDLRSILATALLSLTIIVCGCNKTDNDSAGNSTAASQPAGNRRQIAVIAKSTVNAYWKAVEAGAQQAGTEAGVDILWEGPDSETNHDMQASMVDNMVNRQVAGIVLAPTNVNALVRPVNSAVARGIPVVLIDSTLNSDKPTSVIATDNYAAGAQAAEALIAAMGSTHKHGGKVLMLRFLEGSGSTESREKGFADRIAKEPGLTLVDSMYTKGGGSTTDAADTADALLRRYTKDNVLDADGIFASNQPTAIAMLETLDKYKASGNTFDGSYVGFDAHDVLLKGIRDGKIAAIVAQDPKRMGYLGVQTMMKILNGEKVEPNVATAAVTVTKANIDDPAIKIVTLQN
jgi:ribose transport system substrate-binding protein